MEPPLWTDAHAPDLRDLPQPEVRDRLARAVDEPMNLLVQGPPGAGKTAAIRALAREAHADPANDLVEINVADFFSRTKKEIRDDPRFEQFLTGRSRMAKRDMINRVLKESASYAPVSGEYKTVLLDNAERVREDFQQALRRVMERHHRTTQFVIATRQPSRLIAPIRSRCFPVRVRAPTVEETVAALERVCDAEGAAYDREGLEYLASAADGDLREAILSAQATAVDAGDDGGITMNAAYETLDAVGDDDAIAGALTAARAGEVGDARSAIDDLLDDRGYDGQELLEELLSVARGQTEFGDREIARLHRLAGRVDVDLATGTDDGLHLTHLLAAWANGAGADAGRGGLAGA